MRKAVLVVRAGWAIAWSAFAFLILAFTLPSREVPCPGSGGGGGRGGVELDQLHTQVLCMAPLIPLPILGIFVAFLALLLWRLLKPMTGAKASADRAGWIWTMVSLLMILTLMLGTALLILDAWPGSDAVPFMATTSALVASVILAATYRFVFTNREE